MEVGRGSGGSRRRRSGRDDGAGGGPAGRRVVCSAHAGMLQRVLPRSGACQQSPLALAQGRCLQAAPVAR